MNGGLELGNAQELQLSYYPPDNEAHLCHLNLANLLWAGRMTRNVLVFDSDRRLGKSKEGTRRTKEFTLASQVWEWFFESVHKLVV